MLSDGFSWTNPPASTKCKSCFCWCIYLCQHTGVRHCQSVKIRPGVCGFVEAPPHFLTVHLQNPCPQPDHPNWREDYNIHIIHIIIYDHIYVCIICTYIFVLILFTLYLRFQVCNRLSVIGTKQLQDPGDGMHPWLIQEAR